MPSAPPQHHEKYGLIFKLFSRRLQNPYCHLQRVNVSYIGTVFLLCDIDYLKYRNATNLRGFGSSFFVFFWERIVDFPQFFAGFNYRWIHSIRTCQPIFQFALLSSFLSKRASFCIPARFRQGQISWLAMAENKFGILADLKTRASRADLSQLRHLPVLDPPNSAIQPR